MPASAQLALLFRYSFFSSPKHYTQGSEVKFTGCPHPSSQRTFAPRQVHTSYEFFSKEVTKRASLSHDFSRPSRSSVHRDSSIRSSREGGQRPSRSEPMLSDGPRTEPDCPNARDTKLASSVGVILQAKQHCLLSETERRKEQDSTRAARSRGTTAMSKTSVSSNHDVADPRTHGQTSASGVQQLRVGKVARGR